MDECESLRSGMLAAMSEISLQAWEIHVRVQDQVLTAGMGEVIGLNHLAVHAYMRAMLPSLTILEYKLIFERVLVFDALARDEFKKHRKTT